MWAWLRRRRAPAMPSQGETPQSETPQSETPQSDAPQGGTAQSETPRAAAPDGVGQRQAWGGARRIAPERLFAADVMLRAWLAIKRAGGGAGMDGVTIAQFEANLDEELRTLQTLLASGRYQPRPVRQVWVPKARGGLRPLALWALRDRIAQRAVYDLVAPDFEAHFLPCSFGFRPGLGVPDAVKALQAQREAGLRWVVDADIEDCFGSIPTDRLMTLVAQRLPDRLLRRYIRGWLDADLMNSADGRPRKAGASQGSVLSPLLANIYLHPVDVAMRQERLAFLRYADDFVICCRRRRDAELALAFSEKTLAPWGLRLNPHKTRIVHLDQGLTWLGYFFVRGECYEL